MSVVYLPSGMPRIIGIAGGISAGKSTLAKQIRAAEGHVVVKFADPLKAALRGLLLSVGATRSMARDMLEGDLKEVPSPYLGGRTPRHALQTMGTEWGRGCMGSTFWVDLWAQRAQMCQTPVVADDVRFENEAAAVRALGGVIVQVRRGGFLPVSHHASERGVDPDWVVHNISDLPELMFAALTDQAAQARRAA